MNSRKVLFTSLALFLSITLFTIPGSCKEFLTLGTAGSGGTWYYVGTGICKVVNQYLPEVKITPEATAGGVENVRAISKGKMPIAYTHLVDINSELNKTVKPSDFLLVLAGHPSVTHVSVQKNSPFNTTNDAFKVKGLKMGVGEPGSAIQAQSKSFLAVFGLTFSDVKAAALSQSEQVNAMKDGTIELAMLGSGCPVSSVMDLASTTGVKILEVPDDFFDKVKKIESSWIRFTIPAKTYSGIDKPIKTTAVPSYIIVKNGLDEDLVYKITKTILEHSEEIGQVHKAGAEYNLKNALRYTDIPVGYGIKFHPGAIKYYKEKGIWK